MEPGVDDEGSGRRGGEGRAHEKYTHLGSSGAPPLSHLKPGSKYTRVPKLTKTMQRPRKVICWKVRKKQQGIRKGRSDVGCELARMERSRRLTVLGASVLGNRVTSQFQYGVSTYLESIDLEEQQRGVSRKEEGSSGGGRKEERTYRPPSICCKGKEVGE